MLATFSAVGQIFISFSVKVFRFIRKVILYGADNGACFIFDYLEVLFRFVRDKFIVN